ncbi:MAG: phenylacetic acid degradation protein PaaY [Rhodobacteraceae bacterium]|nr:phenylacetic acid degradation protein PaaY [Paracoccaceae bacterium]
MAAYAFEGRIPVVDPSSFVHPLASLIGDVIVGPGCYIAPFASLRGDFGRIVVEGDASVQDSCTLHGSAEDDCVIGRGATIGHGAVIHGARIGENALVGMNAVVLDGTVIGAECLVGAMSLVRGRQDVPPRRLVAGNPARIVRELAPGEIAWKNDGDGEYQRLARRALAALVECHPLAAPEPDRRRNGGRARPVRLRRE